MWAALSFLTPSSSILPKRLGTLALPNSQVSEPDRCFLHFGAFKCEEENPHYQAASPIPFTCHNPVRLKFEHHHLVNIRKPLLSLQSIPKIVLLRSQTNQEPLK